MNARPSETSPIECRVLVRPSLANSTWTAWTCGVFSELNSTASCVLPYGLLRRSILDRGRQESDTHLMSFPRLLHVRLNTSDLVQKMPPKQEPSSLGICCFDLTKEVDAPLCIFCNIDGLSTASTSSSPSASPCWTPNVFLLKCNPCRDRRRKWSFLIYPLPSILGSHKW